MHRMGFDKLFEVLPQIDLLPCVDRSDGSASQLAIDARIDPRRIVTRQHVFDPEEVEWLEHPGETNGITKHPAGAAIERQAYIASRYLLHGSNAVHQVAESLLRHWSTVESAMERAGVRFAIIE